MKEYSKNYTVKLPIIKSRDKSPQELPKKIKLARLKLEPSKSPFRAAIQTYRDKSVPKSLAETWIGLRTSTNSNK